MRFARSLAFWKCFINSTALETFSCYWIQQIIWTINGMRWDHTRFCANRGEMGKGALLGCLFNAIAGSLYEHRDYGSFLLHPHSARTEGSLKTLKSIVITTIYLGNEKKKKTGFRFTSSLFLMLARQICFYLFIVL